MSLFSDNDVLMYIEIDNIEHKLIKHYYSGRIGNYTKTFDLANNVKEIKYDVNGEEVIQYVIQRK